MRGIWSGWLQRLRGRRAPEAPTPLPETELLPTIPVEPVAETDDTVPQASPAEPGEGDDQALDDQAPSEPVPVEEARDALAWLCAGDVAQARAALATEAADPDLAGLIDSLAEGEESLGGHDAMVEAGGAGKLAGVMLAPGEAARTLAVVFGADDGGFAVRRALAQAGRSNLLFVRDPHSCLAMLGVERLGATYDECLLAITRLARELGVRDIVCIGGGAACYSALRYGLDLGASGVLALGTLTRLERGRYVPGLRPGRRTGALLRLADELGADLDEVFGQAARRPGLVLCRPAKSPLDGLAALPGVHLVEAPRSAGRDLLGWAETSGRLPDLLGQVMRCRPVG